MTNRDSIQRVLNAKKSIHDDNPRSWINFKVDIVIPVAENTTTKYHQRFHKRVSDRVLYQIIRKEAIISIPLSYRYMRDKISTLGRQRLEVFEICL